MPESPIRVGIDYHNDQPQSKQEIPGHVITDASIQDSYNHHDNGGQVYYFFHIHSKNYSSHIYGKKSA
jgi:hypothetical protein